MRPPLLKRQFFLPGTCQGRFLALNMAHQGLVFVIVAAAAFFPLIVTLQSVPLDLLQVESAATHLLRLHEWIWPAFPLALVLIGLHSLFFSHRIAGPLYRFSRVFDAVSTGDLTVSVRIRKHDYLHGEAVRLASMLDALREKIADIEEAAHRMGPLLGQLQAASKSGAAQDCLQLASAIAAQHTDLEKAILQFKTTSGQAPPRK